MATGYAYRVFGTPTDAKKWTFSAWVKKSTDGGVHIFGGGQSNQTGSGHSYLGLIPEFYGTYYDGSSSIWSVLSNAKYRDVSGWYHYVFTYDSAQATASNRIKGYINGEQITSFGTASYPSQNYSTMWNNNGITHYLGRRGQSQNWEGLMSHVHFCDGYAYSASDFGSTDSTTGEWKIKTSPSVSYGNNGFWLFKDDASMTDQSPNSNNFTLSGSITPTQDCPSNVFCTLNPLMQRMNQYFSGNATSLVFGNGNTYAGKVTHGTYFGTIGVSSGKYYWEIKVEDTNQTFGILSMTPNGGVTYGYDDATYNGYYPYGSNNIYTNGSAASGGTYDNTANKIYSFALDATNNKMWIGRDGSFTGDPVNGTGATWSSLPTGHTWSPVTHPMATTQNNNAMFNFGNGYFGTTAVSSAGTNASNNGIFEYDVPTGFTALSTKGLNL
jgi:hypothetical protein